MNSVIRTVSYQAIIGRGGKKKPQQQNIQFSVIRADSLSILVLLTSLLKTIASMEVTYSQPAANLSSWQG